MSNALNLKDWSVDAAIDDGRFSRFPARYDVQPGHCILCGSVGRLQRWGTKLLKVRDTPNFGRSTVIDVTRNRYKCMDCNGTFMQLMPDIDERHRMTVRAVDYIASRAKKETFAKIAGEIGVDEKTIRLVANEAFSEEAETFPVFAPHYLGMDEVMVGGELRAIFTDLGNRTILDLIESRKKPSVTRWLYHMDRRDRVQVVCIDMWRPYLEASRAVFGKNVIVVIDKFHVTKEAEAAVDRVRKAIGKEKSIRGRRHLMRGRHVLLTREKRLTAEQVLTLSGWLGNMPLLKAAHQAKESFHAIYDCKTKAAATKALDRWIADLPEELHGPYKPLLSKVENWRDEILAYFDHRVTNAYTEGMNSLLKGISKVGRGYSFPILRARVLDIHTKRPKGFMVCQSCHQEKTNTKTKFLVPESERRLYPDARPYRVCMDCYRTYIHSWNPKDAYPTLNSG